MVLDIPVNWNLIYCIMFQAVSYQKKAVIVCERIFGVDHPDTIIAYVSSSYHEGSALSPRSYVPGCCWKRGFFKSVLAFCYFTHKGCFWPPRTHQVFKSSFQNGVFFKCQRTIFVWMDENRGFQILMFSCVVQVFKNDPQNGAFMKMSAYHCLWQIETEVFKHNDVMHCTAHTL